MYLDRTTHRRIYSPSDLVTFLVSPFASWMDRLHVERPGTLKPDEADPTMALAAAKGNSHEASHLATLEREGGVVRIENRSLEDTRAAVLAGHRVIFQAALSLGEFRGHADFLVRRDDAPSYDILDTKLARHVKPYFLVQLAAYARMLEAVQGHLPREVGIVLGTGEKVTYRTPTVLDAHARVESQFLALMARFDANAEAPFPDPRADHGRWSSHADVKLDAVDHLSRVAKITARHIAHLEAAGVATLTALAASTERLRVKAIDPRILARLRQQARLQHAKKPGHPPPYEMLPVERGTGRGLEALPAPSKGDVFFDMEGYPFEEGGLEYLFGAVVNETPRFVDWWALDKSQECAALEGFVDFVEARRKQHADLHVYHYAAYEPSRIKKLAGTYGTREAIVDDWLRQGVFVDLLQVVRDAVRIGEPSYSLKNVEHLYREQREGVTGAGQSIVEFARFHESPDAARWQDSAILRPVREYNEDDCVSTRDLRDWLLARQRALRVEPARPYASVDAPGASDTQRETGELVRALLSGAPDDDDSDDARIGRLLAHAMGYHQREDKPQWWQLFAWRDLEAADLVQEYDCLGGLTLVKPLRAVEDRLVGRYAVAPQECKHGEGADLARWDDWDAIVHVTELDLDRGLAVLTFDARTEELPALLALTPGKPFPAGALKTGIRRVAEGWLEAARVAPALRTFLRRDPPKLPRGVSLQQIGESASDALVRVASVLKDTCLVVQGPPGAGKTTSAARAIADLLRAGRRVGVTANAHKAVDKLLADVRALVPSAFIVKVGESDAEDTVTSVSDAFVVKNGRGKKNTERAGGVLVGGTLRAFAKKGASGALDVLFVDEASQVALANLIAISEAGRSLVLLGDPRQLSQPSQGTHPGGLHQSALEYFLAGEKTLPAGQGLFLDRTYRLHPALCNVISDVFYEGRLQCAGNAPVTFEGRAAGVERPEGVLFVAVEHEGNTQSSREEVDAVVRLVDELCRGKLGPSGKRVRRSDIMVIAPYNLQVAALQAALPDLRVGTVDRFQGQEAPIVIFSTATSSAADAPRGLEFLFDARRLNVALSRAQALAILVGSPALAMAPLSTVAQYLSVSMFCRLTRARAQ